MSTHAMLVPDTPEWDRAWSALGDPVAEDPDSGETWQYMGSVRQSDGLWYHEFRHRCLPVGYHVAMPPILGNITRQANGRVNVAVPAAREWTP